MAVDDRKSSFKKTIQDDTKREKLADLLRKDGRVTSRQLKEAEEVQKKKGGWIGHILIKLGYISEEAIIAFVGRSLQIPAIDLTREHPTEEAIKLIDLATAKSHMVIPMEVQDGALICGMVDPTNFNAIEEISSKTKLPVRGKIVRLLQLADAYKKHYGMSEEDYKAFLPAEEEIKEEDKKSSKQSVADTYDMGEIISSVEDELEIAKEEEDEGGPVTVDAALIRLVNGILIKAVQNGVSDIHIEPYEKRYRVRYRKDGALFEDLILPLQMKNALVSRIKIMSNLNIAEKRIPQDGRIKIRVPGREKPLDFRVSILPTLFGESVVMRILDQTKLQTDLTKLGFSQWAMDVFQKGLEAPQGLVLVTGPTGSGKTNTLYSAVVSLNTEDVKILTAEDPVEFNFDGINQVLVRNEVGLTFAAALKSFLRQDPEIILIGEIRDLETAEIAVKASITGHLVFSTLHTNDCPSTVSRGRRADGFRPRRGR